MHPVPQNTPLQLHAPGSAKVDLSAPSMCGCFGHLEPLRPQTRHYEGVLMISPASQSCMSQCLWHLSDQVHVGGACRLVRVMGVLLKPYRFRSRSLRGRPRRGWATRKSARLWTPAWRGCAARLFEPWDLCCKLQASLGHCTDLHQRSRKGLDADCRLRGTGL